MGFIPLPAVMQIIRGVVLSALFMTLPLFAQKQDRQGQISGIVVDNSSGTPVQRAIVVLRPEDNASGGRLAVLTDQDGRYVIANIPSGHYSETIEKQGFLSYNSLATDRRFLEIGADDRLSADARLVPWAVLSGRISNREGENIAGATIRLVHVHAQNGHPIMMTTAQTTSNDLGEFRFYNLPPGMYYVNGYYRDAMSVYGLRIDPDGSGDSAHGETEDYAATWYPSAITPSGATAVRLKAGDQMSGIDIQLQKIRSVIVAGVVDNIPALASGRVTITPADSDTQGVQQSASFTANKSQFTFKSIPPGEYILRAQAGAGTHLVTGTTRVTVNGADVKSTRMTLGAPPSLTGQVILGENDVLPNDLHLTITSASRGTNISLKISDKGHFGILGIPADIYRLSVKSDSTPVGLLSASLGEQNLNPLELSVEGSLGPLVVKLTRSLGSIKGKAADPLSNPITSGLILAVRSGDGGSSFTTRVDNKGEFTFQDLLPGVYRLVCFDDAFSDDDLVLESFTEAINNGSKVTVKDNEAAEITLIARHSPI